MSENLILVFATGGAMSLLVFLQFFLAARHDHVVTATPISESIAALQQQEQFKRQLLLDLDEELRQRRDGIKNIAELQAEVDALIRQRDELTAEWNLGDERRKEIQALRAETEQAAIDHQAKAAELAECSQALDKVREQLQRAEGLDARIELLRGEEAGLTQRVAALGDQARMLEDAEARIATLEARAQELEAERARLEGQTTGLGALLEEVRGRLTADRAALAEVQAELDRARAESAAATAELRQLSNTCDTLTDQRAALEARLAFLNERVREQEGVARGESAPDGDPLRDLEVMPPALLSLQGWKEAAAESEAEALARLARRFTATGLDYHPRVQRAFHTAMKVNETTQMAVLAGISGTGKSQLPRVYAEGMGIGFLQVPVQPRWDSPQDLMGFYNYIEGRFRPTDMARALWQLDAHNNSEAEFADRLLLILLDEMNLARVEYYFSDFLSRLESRPPLARVGEANARKDAEIELEVRMPNGESARRIFPGYNLLFAGTMNEDESTQSLSDKVVDRANVLRFAAPKQIRATVPQATLAAPQALSRRRWQEWVKDPDAQADKQQVGEAVQRMLSLMAAFHRPFGHRMGRAIMAYVANYPLGIGPHRIEDALADQVEMRLLPKLRSVAIGEAEATFGELQSFVAKDLRDDSLAEAIGASVAAGRERDQFVWQGVTRE